jgi:hypothetical protein
MGRKNETNNLEETQGIQYTELHYIAPTYKISNYTITNIHNSPKHDKKQINKNFPYKNERHALHQQSETVPFPIQLIFVQTKSCHLHTLKVYLVQKTHTSTYSKTWHLMQTCD